MDELQTAAPPRLEARFAPATWNQEARTVELSWGRGVEVDRFDWRTEQRFTERLTVDAESVDLTRLNNGAPLLDTHGRWSLDDVIGTVERAWIEKGEGRAIVRFSARDEVKPILRDVQDGILRNVSIGYSVEEWTEARDDRGRLVRTAVRWTPHEISLVPVPADASAQVRAAGDASASGVDPSNPSAARAAEEKTMAEKQPIPAQDDAPKTETRAAVAPAELAAQAVAAERERIAAIDAAMDRVADSIVERTVAQDLRARAVKDGLTAEQYSAAVLEAAIEKGKTMTRRTPQPVQQIGESGDDPAVMVKRMANALAVRSMPKAAQFVTAEDGKPDDSYRGYMRLRPSDMLLELALARGERVSPRDRDRLITRAFHTSSDFPLLLELSGNKMLEAGYGLAAPSYRRWFAQRPFNDFKAHKFLTVGDFPALNEIVEGGEIESGTISEKREQITPKTYGRGVPVTRQMLVNDDLGAFVEFGTMIGRRVADQENSLAYALVNTASGDGPTLAEGSAPVFATGGARNNKAGSASTVTAVALGLGFNAIAAQTSLDGLKLNLQPRYLVCSLIQQFVARQYAASASTPAGTSLAANVFQSAFEVISDANIPNNRWYLFADPDAAPVYVYGYVNGQTAPQIRVFNPVQGRDGLVVEVVHDFAVGAIDFRGGYFNAGAAPT